MSVLSDNLRKLRKELGVNQDALAQYLNISRPAYSQYETGNRNPDWNTISRLADYFQVSADYLLGRTEIKDAVISNDGQFLTKEQLDLLDLYRQFTEQQRARFIGYGERVLEETSEFGAHSADKKKRI